MARPGIEKEKYIEEINKQLSEGKRLEDVTATKLQAIIGGKYSRIAEIVEEFKAGYKTEERTEMPKPEWFKDWVDQVTNFAEGAWFSIASDMKDQINEATESFNNRKAELEAQAQDDRNQIKVLEDSSDQLEATIESLNEVVKVKDSEINKRDLEISTLNGKIDTLNSQITSITAEKSDLATQNKALETLSSKQSDKISDLEEKLADETSKLGEMTAKLNASESSNKDLQASLSQANKIASDAEEKAAKALSEADRVKIEANSKESELTTRIHERDTLISELKDDISILRKRMEEVAEYKGELKSAHQRIDVLEATLAAETQRASALEYKLEQEKDGE